MQNPFERVGITEVKINTTAAKQKHEACQRLMRPTTEKFLFIRQEKVRTMQRHWMTPHLLCARCTKVGVKFGLQESAEPKSGIAQSWFLVSHTSQNWSAFLN